MNVLLRKVGNYRTSIHQLKAPLKTFIKQMTLSTEDLPPKEANRRLRIQLAAAHRGLAQYGLNDRVFNHLSVLSPAASGNGEVLLITPFPIDFADVSPESLLGINEDGDVVEGDGSLHQINGSFHRGFYMGDPSKRCMMHTHSPYICSLACLEDPTLKMINQTSAMLYKQVGYDMEFGGIVDDLEEGKRLGELMAKGNHCALLLMHHGAVTAGPRVADAFNAIVAMELSAMYQINAMQTGRKLVEIKQDTLEKTYQALNHLKKTPLGEAQLSSIIKKLAATIPEFRVT